ncbi:MAG TPA: YbjQ family protein [Patescibacteria group bacterium]|nr:YbjQ family protein [Patescibacteria group bacterium]
MKDIPKIVTGILLILFGIVVISSTLLLKENYSSLIIGILSLIFGVIILLNKKENKIKSLEKGKTSREIIVTTMNDIPGKKVKIIGVVRGNTVRSRNIGRDIMAAFKGIVGGEIVTFTELINQSRDEAYNRMVNNAIEMGADGIIAMRFDTSKMMSSSSEILAYGTAVKFV